MSDCSRALVTVFCLGFVAACSGSDPAPPPRPAPAVATAPPRPAPVQPQQRPPKQTEQPQVTSPADPKSLAEATDLAKRGNEAYKLGRYDEAEGLLKRSITVYPFLAQANLGLGKLFLLRGAAAHDDALIDSARLMFQMAQKNDPSLREPEILLQLFRQN